MTEPMMHDWVDVNSYMRDDYRMLVAGMAARQLANADPELQTLARAAFNSVTVAGARSFSKADFIQQRKALGKAMPGSSQLTALVIALWSLAAAPQIHLLQTAGETAGLAFSPDWSWRAGMQGFYDFHDIHLLSELGDKLGEHASAADADHLKLAALWLGPAVTNREALAAPEQASAEPTDEPMPSQDAS